ncbi:MAG: substrate-binding domain-containing protein [Candidatus Edwardsbacteria bacterium]|jgi:tungstate transport system substrate-binding protein|nr:substrate-binding domain-containing protein [Candidatus Edwardsbacteria bacterium]
MRPLATGLALLVMASAACAGGTLVLASTMSPYDTGLWTELLPKFEEQTGCRVLLYSVPTGAALKLLQGGDADVAVVHDRPAEDAALKAGFGSGAWDLMYNDFVLVGPPANPAGIDTGSADVTAALRKIAEASARFYSRADLSGTHQKEAALWRAAGIDPVDSDWYAATGLGTVKVLAKADQDGAYTIADRATWLTYRKDYPNLRIACQRDQLMLNYIRIIPGTPAKHPHINYGLALAFVRFVTSPEVQEMIRVSGVEKFGEPLYIPNAKNREQ